MKMDSLKILVFCIINCVIADDDYATIENRMLKINRRLSAVKESITAINAKLQDAEAELEENINSLNEMFSVFNSLNVVNFDDIKNKFSKHYLKRERRKLEKLLREPNGSKDKGEEELTEIKVDDEDGDSRYDDFGVVFKASKLKQTTFPENSQKETIVFSDIEYNIGDGYNSTTGIFTAPRQGTYLFTVQLYVKYGHRIEAGVFSNSDNFIAATSLYPGNSACYNFEGIAILEKGDLVEVTHLYSEGEGDLLDNTFNSNFFSGAMIR